MSMTKRMQEEAYPSAVERPAPTTAIQHVPPLPEAISAALVEGDLTKLTTAQRNVYFMNVCQSLGLNPLTRPFRYLRLNGAIVLYATKDATDQLRKLYAISVKIEQTAVQSGVMVVTAKASDKAGRGDSDVGAVFIEGLKGEALANAIMKAHTKAKRRVTLSICGLGMLDETELDSVPGAQVVEHDPETGEVRDGRNDPDQQGDDRHGMSHTELRTLPDFLAMRDAIEAAATLVELADVWKRGTKGMTASQKAELTKRKDRKKTDLSEAPNRPETPPPAAEPERDEAWEDGRL